MLLPILAEATSMIGDKGLAVLGATVGAGLMSKQCATAARPVDVTNHFESEWR